MRAMGLYPEPHRRRRGRKQRTRRTDASNQSRQPVTLNRGVEQVMDRAYEGDATRQLASSLGYSVVVPPRRSRKVSWEYDEELYKRRNEVERLFRRMKNFRRIFTRYDKLDELYIGFILFGMIFDALRSVNRP